MQPTVPAKRPRNKPQAAQNMHINLPPPDVPSFKEPLLPGQAPPLNAQQNSLASKPAQQPQSPYILGGEVRAMEEALKNTTVRLGEIFRYYADMKKIRTSDKDQITVPASLTASLGQEVERFDQLCDMVEVKLLHALKVLNRDAKRDRVAKQEALKLAEAAKEQEEREKAAILAAELPANPQTITSGDETMAVPDPVTAISLSTLPTASDGPSTQKDSSMNIEKQGGRLGKRFPLKLDLSSTTLQTPLHGVTDLSQPKASPVTLVPKSAKPRPDDPMNALNLVGGSGFGTVVGSLPTSMASSFPGSNLPMSSNNTLGPNTNILPGILALVAQQQESAASSDLGVPANFLVSTTPVHPLPNIGSLPASRANVDVIDLTQATPIAESGMNLPMNIDADGTETIDLTMDSPPIPLASIVNVGPSNNNETGAIITNTGDGDVPSNIGLGLGLGLEGSNMSVGPGSSSVEEGPKAFPSLLERDGGVGKVDRTSPGRLPDSDIPNGTAPSSLPSTLPTNATALLASLTANTAKGIEGDSAFDNPEGPTVGSDSALALPELSLPDLSNLEGIDSMGMSMDLEGLGSLNMESLDMDMFGGGLDFGSAAAGHSDGSIGGGHGLEFDAAMGTPGLGMGMGLLDHGGLDMEGLDFLSVIGDGTGQASKSD